MSGYLDVNFWQRLLPQATQLDPAIKHAVAAIGASHEYKLRMQAARHNSETDGLHPFALRQCNKAIKDLIKRPTSKMSQHDLMRALTVSVLFTSFESLCGNREGSIPHIVHAKRLVEQHKRNQKDSDTSEDFPVNLDIIEPVVAHYEVQVHCPVTENDADGMFTMFDLDRLLEFRKLGDARIALERATASLSVVIWKLHEHHTPREVAAISEERARYTAWFQRWDRAFSSFLAQHGANFDRETVDGCRLLKAHQLAVLTFAAVDYNEGEAGWAEFEPHYETIVDLIEVIFDNLPKRGLSAQAPQEAYLSSTMGMSEPLYCTATRCTDPVIAERARSLMKKLPQNEAIHSAWKTSYLEQTLGAASGKFHSASSGSTSEFSTPTTQTDNSDGWAS